MCCGFFIRIQHSSNVSRPTHLLFRNSLPTPDDDCIACIYTTYSNGKACVICLYRFSRECEFSFIVKSARPSQMRDDNNVPNEEWCAVYFSCWSELWSDEMCAQNTRHDVAIANMYFVFSHHWTLGVRLAIYPCSSVVRRSSAMARICLLTCWNTIFIEHTINW